MNSLLQLLARLALVLFLSIGVAACGGSGSNDNEPVCEGDECETPCEGDDCETPCEGDDCETPCEGDDCETPCEGDDCETPCEGDDCETPCEGDECNGENTTVNEFAFSSHEGAVPGITMVSEIINIGGLGDEVEVEATVENALMSVNAAPPSADAVTVKNDDYIILYVDAPAAGETVVATLDVGGVSASLSVTAADPAVKIASADGFLGIEWAEMTGAFQYKISENPSGADGYTVIAQLFGEDGEYSTATEFSTSVPAHQFAWGDARYLLEACGAVGECITVAELETTQEDSIGAIAYLKSDAPSEDALFGWDTALDGLGLTLAVGEAGIADGAVHIFTRVLGFDLRKGPWQKHTVLKLPEVDRGKNYEFGSILAMSDDGKVLVAGMLRADSSIGVVYIFTQDEDGNWDEGVRLDNPNPDTGDWFGYSVAVSEDGKRIAVGAPGEDSNIADDPTDNSLDQTGAVYVFDRNETSGDWELQGYLKATEIKRFARFGHSTAISATGHILVGAPFENRTGAAYLFTPNFIFGGWSGVRLAPDSLEVDARFGMRVAMSAGAGDILISADKENESRGSIYVISPLMHTVDQKISSPVDAPDMRFGHGLAIARGGQAAVASLIDASGARGVGGDQADSSAPESGGAFYLEKDATGEWQVVSFLKAPNTEEGDGAWGVLPAISITGDTIALGFVNEASNAADVNGDQDNNDVPNAGAVYVY